jgi:hypothetical protein
MFGILVHHACDIKQQLCSDLCELSFMNLIDNVRNVEWDIL